MEIHNEKNIYYRSYWFYRFTSKEVCVKVSCVAFDRYNSNNDYGWLKNSQYLDKMELILGDIRDYVLFLNH